MRSRVGVSVRAVRVGTVRRLRRSPWAAGAVAAALVVPLGLYPIAASVLAASPAPAAPAAPLVASAVVTAAAPPSAVKAPVSVSAKPTEVTWPAAANATLTLAAAGRIRADAAGRPGPPAQAPGTPVVGRSESGAGTGPASIDISVQSHAAAAAAGVDGVVFTARPVTGTAGQVSLGVDYKAFSQAYGGDYGSRLTLVSLPACALTTPQVAACRVRTPVASTNDADSQTVTGRVSLADPVRAHTVVLAAVSGPSDGDGGGSAGTFAATSLKASGSWTAGGSSGTFDYTYPVQVPPAPSTLVPSVNLSYDSGSVDGETAGTNSQADWLGDGWSTPENYVEESFQSCSDSPEGVSLPSADQTGDECYDGPILTLSLNGSTSSLVCASNCDSGSAIWKPQTDDGEVVTHVTTSNDGSGTYDGDYWTVTDRTGTTFSFGLNKLPGYASGDATTNSVQYEPVYSANPGDPCYSNSGFTASVCTMAYRWNLDYVKDVHGNAMAYYYKQDFNAYAQDNNTTSATSYVRDAHLDHIDYGFTDGNAYTSSAPDQVDFQTGDRCFSGTCDPLNSTNAPNWPDVPWDLNCTAGAACQVTSPSMWSTVSLAAIVTKQWNGTGYASVDSYAFTQTMPTTAVGSASPLTSQTLWLSQIVHTGSDTSAGGVAVTMKPVVFGMTQLANRADTTTGLPPMEHYRIGSVTTETGSVIGVNYELVNQCSTPVTINPATNTSSCYPVSWTPSAQSTPILDWFNKYSVQSVTQSDPIAHSPTLYTGYTYLGGGAWHYDDNELVKAKYRTYGQWRGFGDVETFTGQTPDAPTETQTTYYRGMSDDNNSTAVTLTDSQGGTHDDTDQLAGDTLESTSYNFAGGPITTSTINSYWVSAATATRLRTGLPALTANVTGQIESWTRTAITDPGTTTPWRITETDTTFDTNADPTFGLPTEVFAHGDLANTSQQQCTTTTYAAPNTSANLVDLVSETEVDAAACGGANPNGASAPTTATTNALTPPPTSARPGDVISDTRSYYDLQPLGSLTEPSTTPTQGTIKYGDVSVTQKASDYSGGNFTYQLKSATTYDSYGRTLDSWDALGNKTQTINTQTNGLTTSTETINPLNQAATTTLDPERGLPVATVDPNGITAVLHYDGVGRTIAVWENNRSTSLNPTVAYTYAESNTAPSVVTTQTLNTGGGQYTSYTIYDSLLRVRETQSQTPQGGRLINDTFYDSRGWAWKTNNNYFDSTSAPDSTLASVTDASVPNQDVISFNGSGQPVQDQSLDDSQVKSTSYEVYYGDKTITVPDVEPGGKVDGTPNATVTDALGRTTELDQYTTAPTVSSTTAGNITTVTATGGTTQATDYVYNSLGEETDVKDMTTSEDWGTSYNMLGQVKAKSDPDAGATTGMLYDLDGNLTQATNAMNKTLSYTYDGLGRELGTYDGPVSTQSASDELVSLAYDSSTVPDAVGQLTSETSYTGGNPYTITSKGFNVFGESLGETITLPSSEGALAGSYAFTNSYFTNTGLPDRDTYPASPGGGALPAETVTHGYGALDLPATLVGTNIYANNTSYNAYGQVNQEQMGTATVNAYLTNTYDPHTGQLTDQNVKNTTVSPTPIDDMTYTYDTADNITSQTETRQGTTAETQCYQYDQLDRLTQAWTATDNCAATPTVANHSTVGDGIANAAYWTTYGLDSLGQRTTETDHSLTSGVADSDTTYTYGGTATGCQAAGGANTLRATSTTGPGGNSSSSYCYDAEGNTIQRDTAATGQQSMTWNDLGQLSAVTNASGGSSYIYGPDGNLLLEKDPGTTILYLPSEQLSLNTTTQAITGTRFYALPGGGQAVRTGAGSAYTFQTTDLHSTASLTLNSTFTTSTFRQFTPYGAPRGTAPTSWPDNLGFLNSAQDTTTGLTDVGARWYDPSIGRFTSLDPEFEPASPQELNGYTYAGANPVTNQDPTGLRAECPHCGSNGQTLYSGGCTNSTNCAPPPCDSSCKQQEQVNTAAQTLSNDKASQAQIQAAISALENYMAEQKKLAQELDAEQGGQVPGCSEKMFWLGACAAEGKVISDGYAATCGPGWLCAVTPILSILPMGEIFDALGITDMAVTAGSKALSLLPDGAQSLIDGGAQLLSDLKGKLAAATAKVLGDQSSLADAAAGCANSFAGATLVLMADGTSKPIDQVKVGDKVADNLPGVDPGTGDQAHTVTDIHVTYTDTDFTNITVHTPTGPATITGTAQHPYWDYSTNAWTDADQLSTGDKVQTTDGDTATVLALTDYTSHTIVTYNLTVDGLHTYYVEAETTPVLVHNCPTATGGDSTPNIIKNAVKNGTYTPRLKPDGTLDIFAGRSGTPLAIVRKWAGAQIFDVPGGGNSYRILINQYGDIGWISGHEYNLINVYVPPSA